jgi:hypothetical protein
MLDRLTVATFTPAVGEAFTLDDDGLALELLAARTRVPDAPPTDAAGLRTPFSLTFRGPPEPILAQRIRRLRHADLGALELFLVPIGRDGAGIRYEAVFG